MNLPGFTGDASLCQTNRHYWTARNRQAIHLPAPTIETIHPAREEVIEVHSCPPGYNDWGGTCYPVLSEPPLGGGGGGPSTSGESSGDTPPPGGGRPGPIPKPTSPPRKYQPTPLGKCHVLGGTIAKGLYMYDAAKGWWECCREASGGAGLTCVVCEENSAGNLCRDGHR
jgi:hypothetical protein